MTTSLPPVLVLIGLRGAGKTTLGTMAAERLSRPFVDLDTLALAICGQPSIQDVFQSHGEATWREAEARALEQAIQQPGQVLALGGGAPMVEDIATRLHAARDAGTARILLLDAPDAILAGRIGPHGEDRPPLLKDDAGTPLDALEECRQLRVARGPRYAELASCTIDTSGAIEDAVKHMVQAADDG